MTAAAGTAVSGPVRPVALKDEVAALAARTDSKARAAESAAEAALAFEAVRDEEPAVLDGEAGTVAAGPDSEARAAESAAEAASPSKADRLAEAAVLMDKSASVAAAGLDSEPWAVE